MNGKQDMKKAFVMLLHAKQWAEISSVTEREWKIDQVAWEQKPCCVTKKLIAAATEFMQESRRKKLKHIMQLLKQLSEL